MLMFKILCRLLLPENAWRLWQTNNEHSQKKRSTKTNKHSDWTLTINLKLHKVSNFTRNYINLLLSTGTRTHTDRYHRIRTISSTSHHSGTAELGRFVLPPLRGAADSAQPRGTARATWQRWKQLCRHYSFHSYRARWTFIIHL